MSEIDQGGFVYPAGQKVLGYDDILPAHPGITLRQHYAGLLSSRVSEGKPYDEVAERAFIVADAMIEAGKQ